MDREDEVGRCPVAGRVTRDDDGALLTYGPYVAPPRTRPSSHARERSARTQVATAFVLPDVCARRMRAADTTTLRNHDGESARKEVRRSLPRHGER